MLLVLIRTIILYIIVIAAFRFMGKRQLGELQASELVITILISNIASIPIEDTSIPLLSGIIPILTLVCLEVLVSGISMVNRKFRNALSGNPIIIIKNGKIIQKSLWDLRFSVDDVIEELREQNIFDIRDVEFAVVETDGKISVFKKSDRQELTPQTVSIDVESATPHILVVSDGFLIDKELKPLGIDDRWIAKTLKDEKINLSDVFIMMINQEKDYFIVPKEKVS